MKLILCRHGNTFDKDDKVTWVGAQQDLPLTKYGEEQAQNVTTFLKTKGLMPNITYAASLKRTQKFAEIIGSTVKTDDRLIEINYGSWGGKTTEELVAEFGQQDVDNWQQHNIFSPHWVDAEFDVKQRVLDFINHCIHNHQTDDKILIVSSNGILRYFLQLLPDFFDQLQQKQQLKMKTGAVSLLTYDNHHWHCDFWNKHEFY